MSRRHQINAVICVLVLLHAVYRFAAANLETATHMWLGLVAAEAVLGLAGAAWFWHRSRQAPGGNTGEH